MSSASEPRGEAVSESCDPDNYYALLGVARGCSAAEIKRAYQKLALKLHPDRGGGKAAVTQMARVTEAWNVLKNPALRAIYDKHGIDGLDAWYDAERAHHGSVVGESTANVADAAPSASAKVRKAASGKKSERSAAGEPVPRLASLISSQQSEEAAIRAELAGAKQELAQVSDQLSMVSIEGGAKEQQRTAGAEKELNEVLQRREQRKAVQAQQLAEEKAQLQAEVLRLKAQLATHDGDASSAARGIASSIEAASSAAAAAEKEQMRKQLEEAKAQHEKVAAELVQATQRAAELATEKTKAEEDLAGVRTELVNARSEMDRVRSETLATAAVSFKSDALEREVRQAQGERDVAQRQAAVQRLDVRLLRDELRVMEAERTRLFQEQKQAQTMVSEAASARACAAADSDGLRALLQDLRRENTKLELSNGRTERELHGLRKSSSALEDEVTRLKLANKEMSDKLATQQNAVASTEAAANSELEQLRRQLDTLKLTHAHTEQELAARKEANASLQDEVARLASSQKELQEQTAAAAEAGTQELEEARRRCGTLELHKGHAEEQLSELQRTTSALEDEVTRLKLSNADMRAQLAYAQREAAKHQSVASQLREAKGQSDVPAAKLATAVPSVEPRVEAIISELAVASSSASTDEARPPAFAVASRRDSGNSVDSASVTVAEGDRGVARTVALQHLEREKLLTEHQRAIDKAQAVIEGLRGEITALKAELREAQVDRSNLKERAEGLMVAQTAAQQSAAEQGEMTKAAYEAKIEALQAKLETATAHSLEKDAERADLSLVVKEAAGTEQSLRRELKLAHTEHEQLVTQHAKALEHSRHLEQRAAETTAQQQALHREVAAADEAFVSLEAWAKGVMESTAAMQAKVEGERSGNTWALEKALAQLEGTRSELTATKLRTRDTSAITTDLELQVKELRTENAALRASAKEEAQIKLGLQEELRDYRAGANDPTYALQEIRGNGGPRTLTPKEELTRLREDMEQMRKEHQSAMAGMTPPEEVAGMMTEVMQRMEARSSRRYERAVSDLVHALLTGERDLAAQLARQAWLQNSDNPSERAYAIPAGLAPTIASAGLPPTSSAEFPAAASAGLPAAASAGGRYVPVTRLPSERVVAAEQGLAGQRRGASMD